MVLHVAAAAAATAHCTRCCHLQLWTARLHGSGAALSVASLVDLLGSWRRCERTDAGQQRQQQNGNTSSSPRSVGEGLADLIGNTPLIRLKSLSEQTGCEVRDCWLPALALMRSPPTAWPCHHQLPAACHCHCFQLPHRRWLLLQILAKAEFLNPGGSVKDRVALEIVQEALDEGRLAPGGLVAEGTVGSTGVSLAMCAAAAGCRAFVAMPDDAAIEKAQMLQVTSGGC